MAADGRFRSRKPPELACVLGNAMVDVELQLIPPLLEVYEMNELKNASAPGTITPPLGLISGCPPNPTQLLKGLLTLLEA